VGKTGKAPVAAVAATERVAGRGGVGLALSGVVRRTGRNPHQPKELIERQSRQPEADCDAGSDENQFADYVHAAAFRKPHAGFFSRFRRPNLRLARERVPFRCVGLRFEWAPRHQF
jgi:hypothetical protein